MNKRSAFVLVALGMLVANVCWAGNNCTFKQKTLIQCINNGYLSGGYVNSPASPTCAGMLEWKANGVTDNGGKARYKIEYQEADCPPKTKDESITVTPTYSWTISGPLTASGQGNTASINATEPGVYSCVFTVTANRDCPPTPITLNGQQVTVIKLESETQKPAADGVTPNTRQTIGVCERVTITSPINVTWSVISGGGTVSPLSGTMTVFTAGEVASTSIIKATAPGGVSCTLTLSVVPPDGIIYSKVANQNIYPVGTAGAGMLLKLRYTPLSVCFGEIDGKEIGRNPINVTGYFIGKAGFHSPNPDFVAIGDDNYMMGEDNASSGISARPQPWSDGSYTWPIPNNYNRRGAAGDGHWFVDTSQTFTITPNGTCGVTKGAASCLRHPITGYVP